MSKKTVFISYRRDTAGKYFARSIEEALTHRGYDVFLDVDCIDAGKWAKQILTEVPKRAHFLLLLTPGGLDHCADEDDWVLPGGVAAGGVQQGLPRPYPARERALHMAQTRRLRL